jgi:hypothetical protein
MTLTALSREPLINPRIVLLEMTAQIGVPRCEGFLKFEALHRRHHDTPH